MLGSLGLKSLEQRTMEGCLLVMYKLSHKKPVDMNTNQYLIPHQESRTRGCHELKYRYPRQPKMSLNTLIFPEPLKVEHTTT